MAAINIFLKAKAGLRSKGRLKFQVLLLAGLVALFSLAANNPATNANDPVAAAETSTANTEPIVLQVEQLPFTPKAYHIADIIDERENKKAVAWLLPVTTTGATTSTVQPVDLKGGGLAAINQFVRQSLARNTKLNPLIVKLKKCEIREEAAEGGRVQGRIAVVMEFNLQREGELLPLTEYKGGVRYSRDASHQKVVEPALRKSLVNALQYLDKWMEENAAENPLLAREVKVHFSDYTTNNSSDTVFYSPDRPLVWDDFRGNPRPGPYAAAIMPSFSYSGPTEVIDGVIHLKLNMKVFALRDNCWVRSHARNSYGLNHEQRHFEIVRLVVERFKEKISAKNLSVADYAGILAYEYIESFREMNRMQEQYDGETSHGTDVQAQERWNRRLDEELKAIGLKK